MPYRRILEKLLTKVRGSIAALLLDAQGELVVGAGALDEKQRLIGAYAGISLGMALRIETLRARGATDYEARMLDVAEGTPVMYAERVTYAADGVAVEYLEAVWRGDRYDFKLSLTRPA